MEWELVNIQYLLGKSINSAKTGHSPLVPMYKKSFFNRETAEFTSVTDLDIKKQKRTSSLLRFKETYIRSYEMRKVSLFTAVVYQEHYARIGTFINTISKKFSRNGSKRLGHIWVRDIGDKEFRRHFHVLIAAEPISQTKFNDMFKKVSPDKYKIEPIDTVKGISDYLIKKELYAAKRERSYQASTLFRKPKAS